MYYTESPLYRKSPPYPHHSPSPYHQEVRHHNSVLDTVFRSPSPAPSSTPAPAIVFEEFEEELGGPLLQTAPQLDAPPTFSALIAGPPAPSFSRLMAAPAPSQRRLQQPRPRPRPRVVPDPPRPHISTAQAEDRIDGRAYGEDYVGAFTHHTGALGPFGFYANFYDEK